MTRRMRDVPPANRSPKGAGDRHDVAARGASPSKRPGKLNTSEPGDAATIKQNTKNMGVFAGRRTK